MCSTSSHRTGQLSVDTVGKPTAAGLSYNKIGQISNDIKNHRVFTSQMICAFASCFNRALCCELKAV